jgi:hypothetical protein
MPRLPAELRESQRLIVERIKATNPASPVSNERIAEVAGCSSTMVSKWISPGKDAREIKWGEVQKLADVFGWDVVVGRAASAKGYRVTRSRSKVAADPVGAAIALTGKSLAVVDVVRAAWADGKVDARERALIREATAAVIDQADVVGAVGEA